MNYDKHKNGLAAKILECDSKAEAAYLYCKEHNIVGWRQAEQMMFVNPTIAFKYHVEVRKDEWTYYRSYLGRLVRDNPDLGFALVTRKTLYAAALAELRIPPFHTDYVTLMKQQLEGKQ